MASDQQGSGTAGAALLKERYEIDPTQRLPDLDMPQAEAYHCEDRRGSGRSLYALLCRADMPLRVGAMRSLKGVQVPGLLTLVEYGIVDWLPGQRRQMAVVYERPSGGRVLPRPGQRFDAIPEAQFIKRVMKPIIQALQEMSQRGVVHRAVRLDNLFWHDQTKERLVLGDCVTAPPGYNNHVVYEPLYFAMANPEGRGQGYSKDDLYSLGICFLGLLTGRDPAHGWEDNDVIRAKLAQSTYASFASDNRVPLNLIEVMRGVLCDDYKERWDLENVDLWMNGRCLSPLQPKPPKRAQRPFKFEGVDYFTCRELAHAMASSWDAALSPILDGRVEVWLRRGMEDNETADAISVAVRLSQSGSEAKSGGDYTVARVLILLDPAAPLRYRELRVTLDGFGAALAAVMMQKKQIRLYAEVLARDLAKNWIDAQGIYSPELGHFENQFKDLTANLQTQMIGWGMERCVYELNEHLHCQSPLIEKEYVSEIRELLPALDRVSLKIDPKTKPVDRHIAAYIGCKWERDTKVQFRVLNENSSDRQILGMVSLLAVLQWRLGPPALHGLAGWIGAQLAPIIAGYHGRMRRKELEKEVPKLVRKGSLPELYNLLDNQEERQRDNDGFAWAKAEYAAADQQCRALEAGKLVRDEQAEMIGQQAAAVLSVFVAIVTVCIVLFMRIM
ncbi:protein kinase domain-containing protein [Insolitispirillum peregrinum]